jgi:hypothetical protein
MKIPNKLQMIADACDGKITEISGPLPDGSGFAIMSMPLRKDHWIYGERGAERKVCGPPDSEDEIFHEPPPMPFRMGANWRLAVGMIEAPPEASVEEIKSIAANGRLLPRELMADMIRIAGRYAIRASTMKGADMDFDPDAMLQNLVVGMLGYWTDDGFTSDEWANPEPGRRWCCNGDGEGNHSQRCRHSPESICAAQSQPPTQQD